MTAHSHLPPSFEELEPFVEYWAAEDFHARIARRFSSDIAQARRFYDAVAPRAADILRYLEQFPLLDLPPDAKRLYQLLMTLAHVTVSIEHHGALSSPGTIYNPAVRLLNGPMPL